ncbi:hypothetical protein ACWDRX_25140 [Streptomyces nigra]|uniref:hypothetical protein n=1 Tax=Streptomyces nigra TaxID=1827580 RepID=UPI003630E35A
MIEKQIVGLAAELDALSDEPPLRRGPECSVGAFAAALGEADAAALNTALESSRITAKGIADTISRHGDPVSAFTVSRHRRRGESHGCRCPR